MTVTVVVAAGLLIPVPSVKRTLLRLHPSSPFVAKDIARPIMMTTNINISSSGVPLTTSGTDVGTLTMIKNRQTRNALTLRSLPTDLKHSGNTVNIRNARAASTKHPLLNSLPMRPTKKEMLLLEGTVELRNLVIPNEITISKKVALMDNVTLPKETLPCP